VSTEYYDTQWIEDIVGMDVSSGSDASPFNPQTESPFLAFPSTSVVTNNCKTTTESEGKEVEEDDADDVQACCNPVKQLLGVLGEDCSRLPVGALIRLIYQTVGPFDPGKRDQHAVLAFDISFLWHNEEALGTCADSQPELITLREAWRSRPALAKVSNCHSSAVSMLQILGGGQIEKVGVTGAGASNALDMSPHIATFKSLCISLQQHERAIWQVSHCGHSWTFIKRLGRVEVIDAFANDRGLGIWGLTAEEVETVKWPKKVHPPPAKRIWTVEELLDILPLLVHESLETRHKGQERLVNYPFENDSGSDHLPTGAFGYDCRALKTDGEIVRALAARFCHARNRWKELTKK
jgi:hypothetical protein